MRYKEPQITRNSRPIELYIYTSSVMYSHPLPQTQASPKTQIQEIEIEYGRYGNCIIHLKFDETKARFPTLKVPPLRLLGERSGKDVTLVSMGPAYRRLNMLLLEYRELDSFRRVGVAGIL